MNDLQDELKDLNELTIELNELDEYEESKEIIEYVDNQIIDIVNQFDSNVNEYLTAYRNQSKLNILDKLSTIILDREDYWKNKTKKDVENYHNLKLYEYLVEKSLHSNHMIFNDSLQENEKDSFHLHHDDNDNYDSDNDSDDNDNDDDLGKTTMKNNKNKKSSKSTNYHYFQQSLIPNSSIHSPPTNLIKLRDLTSENILNQFCFFVEDSPTKLKNSTTIRASSSSSSASFSSTTTTNRTNTTTKKTSKTKTMSSTQLHPSKNYSNILFNQNHSIEEYYEHANRLVYNYIKIFSFNLFLFHNYFIEYIKES